MKPDRSPSAPHKIEVGLIVAASILGESVDGVLTLIKTRRIPARRVRNGDRKEYRTRVVDLLDLKRRMREFGR